MAKRKTISKRIRFEVFKRDDFKCQYCGKAAPDVVLHLDHINPISKGGEDEILNLVTSCSDCNLGKSNRELDDDSAITKQRAQLEELNERREQLEMMLQWRESMKDIQEATVDEAVRCFEEACLPGSSVINEHGRKTFKRLISKHGLNATLDAIELSTERYIRRDRDGEATQESVETAFRKVGGVLRTQSLPEDTKRLYYIRGIVRNRMYCDEVFCLSLLKNAYSAGADLEDLVDLAKEARNWTDWRDCMVALIEGAE